MSKCGRRQQKQGATVDTNSERTHCNGCSVHRKVMWKQADTLQQLAHHWWGPHRASATGGATQLSYTIQASGKLSQPVDRAQALHEPSATVTIAPLSPRGRLVRFSPLCYFHQTALPPYLSACTSSISCASLVRFMSQYSDTCSTHNQQPDSHEHSRCINACGDCHAVRGTWVVRYLLSKSVSRAAMSN